MSNVTPVFGLGKTYYGPSATIPSSPGNSIEYEGMEHDFEDVAPGQDPGAKTRRTRQWVHAICVRNKAGVAVVPGDVVKWKATFRRRRTDVKTDTADMEVAGVVDPHLPSAGVRDGDLYWLIRKGLCEVNKPSGAISEGALLVANASGQAAAAGAPASDQEAQDQATNALGRCQTAAASGDTQVLAYLDIRN